MERPDASTAKRELRSRMLEVRRELGPEGRSSADAAIAEKLVASPEFERAGLVLTYLAMAEEVETRGIIERAWALGKTVALPRCVPGTRQMRWYRVDGPGDLDLLEKSPFGVLEPAPDPLREVPVPEYAPEPEPLVVSPVDALSSDPNRTGDADDASWSPVRVLAADANPTEPTSPVPAYAPEPEPRALALVPGLAFDRRGYRLGYGGGFYDVFLASFAGTSLGLCRVAQLVDDLAAMGALDSHDRPVDHVVTD